MSDPISLSDVTVERDGAAVLRDISFALGASERLAIVGPNGAGKTTLLRTIAGLERAKAGRVTLFGKDCGSEADFRMARPRIGFLFQDSDDQLFCPTVAEDVAFGPLNTGCTSEEAFARASEVLGTLGIDHLGDRIIHKLSGGEKRLVCLAGLLAMRPDVLLLDEPTNGARLRDRLRAFGGAMILVSHDDGFVADMANRALVLEGGGLRAAEIHEHPHMHSHAHVHTLPEGA